MTKKARYDADVCLQFEKRFSLLGLSRPFRRSRYEAGTILEYQVSGIAPDGTGTAEFQVKKFVGGGFAGQVYRVRLLSLKSEKPVGALVPGEYYALKILIPPSRFSLFFRNLLYRIGFQGPFQLQLNHDAARSGALWQKFIRAGYKSRHGSAEGINDVHATLVDHTLGSCGEVSDWVDGRTWQLEVDDRMDLLRRFNRKGRVNEKELGSPEYRAKKKFMADLVVLLHEMGAGEFARQYEWSTGKSQPNCLKRNDVTDPEKGLVAVDFRAGLTLLPFLPMSPGDLKLIWRGICRGRLVQFDRGDIKKLRRFVSSCPEDFAELEPRLKELENLDRIYRNSLPDITHHHVRLLYKCSIWKQILKSARRGWLLRGFLDESHFHRFEKNTWATLLFGVTGILPFLGSGIRRFWGNSGRRRHMLRIFTESGYIKKTLLARRLESLTEWHRKGRTSAARTRVLADSGLKFLLNLPLAVLPPGLHRFFSDSRCFRERLGFLFVRPIKLYFSPALREQWLRDMLKEGRKKRILSTEDSQVIEKQISEPFIQKYLKSLAVHVCTLPVTQVVSVIVSWIYVAVHPELSGAEAMAAVAAILVLFQITPISPGSLVRGFYVLYLVIRERNLKDYNIALTLSFFKYIGYLAFPIQMTYRYPALARFMAGHWATEAVHVVPVFGESGALLEHWIFNLFYNWPLTLRRRMTVVRQIRTTQKKRTWHVLPAALLAGSLLGGVEWFFKQRTGLSLELKNVWWLALVLPAAVGALCAHFSGKLKLSQKIVLGVAGGILTALVYVLFSAHITVPPWTAASADILVTAFWRIFVFSVWAAAGALLGEMGYPLKKRCEKS